MNRRTRSVLSFLGTTLLCGTMACGGSALPPAVTEADALLRRDAQTVESSRPQLVAQARDLLVRAKGAAEQGDPDRATLLARQSIQKMQAAKNFTARERAERMKRALDKSNSGGVDSKRLAAIEGRVAKLESGEQAGGAAALRARRAITKARERQLAASKDEAATKSALFGQGQAQLESALDSYDTKAYPEAADAAQSAAASFAAALSSAATGEKPAPSKGEPQTAPARPLPLPADIGAGDLRSVAERTIVGLQFKRSESLGTQKDRSCVGLFREFDSMVDLAQKRFDAGDYQRAYEFALRADERFRACDAQTNASNASSAANAALAAKKEADEEAARRRASAQIQKAQVELARVQAIAPQSPTVAQGTTLLANADSWFAKSAYTEATDLATRALTVLSAVKGAGAGADPAAKQGTATKEDAEDALADANEALKQAPEGVAKTRGTLLVADAQKAFTRKAWDETVQKANKATEQLRAAIKDATCTEAKTLATEGRAFDRKLATTKLEEADAKARREALTELAAVDRKVQKKECDDALTSATAGRDVLASLVGEAPTPAKAEAKSGTLKPETKPESKPGVTGKPWESSLTAIQQAERAQSEARARGASDAERPRLTDGDRALEDARAAYAKDDFVRAEARAKDARIAFDGIRGGGAVAVAKPAAAGKSEPAKQPPATVAQQRIAEIESQGTYANVDPSWKAAYAKVFSALAMRDEAAAAAPKEKAKLASADAKLASARAAWNQKSYAQAQGFAEAAIAILAPLVGQPDGGSAEELEIARNKADAALREAGQLATVCEQERCVDRNVGKYAEAKELLASAKRAYDGKRWKSSADLAAQARDGYDAILKTPLKDAKDPALDAAKLRALQLEADDAIRDANIAKKICDTKGCKERDRDGSMIRAVEIFASANVAYTDKRYDTARDRAREVEKIYKSAIATVPTFEISEKAVTRAGDQLVTTPRVLFTNAKSTITPSSMAAVDALAKVLLANKEAIRRVNLIGYTDNRGAAAKNQKLSADRAGALRAALLSRGVPGDMLTAEGRGIENPIADNGTTQGRETNRRVEIHVELKDGVQ